MRLMPSVVPRTKMMLVRRRRIDEARAPSRAPPRRRRSSARPACARRGGCSSSRARRSSERRSITACGFCVVAPLSSQTSGRPLTFWSQDREVAPDGVRIERRARRRSGAVPARLAPSACWIRRSAQTVEARSAWTRPVPRRRADAGAVRRSPPRCDQERVRRVRGRLRSGCEAGGSRAAWRVAQASDGRMRREVGQRSGRCARIARGCRRSGRCAERPATASAGIWPAAPCSGA